MPSTRHHNEWLSLIEVSGPFLSVPVLERVLPQGLDAHDPDHSRLVKLAFEEWEDNQQGDRPSPAIHREWVSFVLRQTLGLPDEVLAEAQAIPQTLKATVAEHGENLRPDIIVKNPEGVPGAGKARLLVQLYPSNQGLEKPLHGRHWKASPATRMMELLHATETRLGLVTNGEHWMVVDAPKGETTGFASWYASLWFDEPLTLRAFRTLLGVRRFFSAADDGTLEAMLAESAKNQQEVTDRLGYQVRRAVEVFVQVLDRADQDHGRTLLDEVTEAELYEAALTVMMRLVFLFSAEERGLLLLGDDHYDQHYAVSTLVAQLQEAADQHGEEVLERRHDAWARLLATFRAVFGGVAHERMKLLPYAGKLFDPDRFAFLEGRRKDTKWADPLQRLIPPVPIDNRTALHLLRSLQYLELQGEARRLSFRALDIEQIGHVYEGLLDHTARRATEPMLSLTGAKGDEPEVPLSELERLKAGGEAGLLKWLKDQTGRSESALKKALNAALDAAAARKLRAACGDEELFQRVRPFAGLVRNDTFDRPVVIRAGSAFVTAGTDRRSSGTHYTPRSLTEPIVQYTLEPLVYIGPAEGKPREEWRLRSAKEILELKVCDMACGSGAFLVQACRYLSERLMEAWEDAEKKHPDIPGTTPEALVSTGAVSEQLIPTETDERVTYALRVVAQRCLYGVDKNPLAAEMAKLSLWLLTLAKDKPFEFLDHAIRCGDSLVGLHHLDQLRRFNLDGTGEDNTLFLQFLDPRIKEAIALRHQIAEMQANTVEDVAVQDEKLREANEKIDRLKCAADLLISAELLNSSAANRRAARDNAAIQVAVHFHDSDLETFRHEAQSALAARETFHWPLEFPEVVVQRSGFDAIVCNPPFLGGKRISTMHGAEYERFLKSVLTSKKGGADLCAYFFIRSFSLLHKLGNFGLLATNTIAQTDTREIGLSTIEDSGTITRAWSSMPWPGVANVVVALVHAHKGVWQGQRMLNDKFVARINSYLSTGENFDKPHRLARNKQSCFGTKGTYVHGKGFVVSADDAEDFIQRDKRNAAILQPYLIAQDFTSDPNQTPSRFAINFGDMDSQEAMSYGLLWDHLVRTVKPVRDGLRGQIHEKCFWKFWDRRDELYERAHGLSHVLVCPEVSKYSAFALVINKYVFSSMVNIVASNSTGLFACLQSTLHGAWAWQHGSTMKTDLRYTTSDCLDTFPFPFDWAVLGDVGGRYHAARQAVMRSFHQGLTKTYNQFHDESQTFADIQNLRSIHVEMDHTVAAAYGWTDLDLNHGFNETKQGIRFTISESARREVLARLLRLNHERHEEEVRQGLHDTKRGGKGGGRAAVKAKGRGRKSKSASDAPSLFGDEDDPDPAGARPPARSTLPVPNTGDVWYFAYGSNLSVTQKEDRTGRIRSAVPCRLAGYRFAFNKRGGDGSTKANIVPDPAGDVWGVAYLCNREAMRAMDRNEGVSGGHYLRHPVEVVARTGESISAVTYVAEPNFLVEGIQPSEDYLHRILDGARHYDLPKDYVRSIEAEAGVEASSAAEPPARPIPIDEFETDAVMAAFRQAARGRGWLERDELLKDVSLVLGYQRLGPKIDEALRGHLRAAIRRRIIEPEGPTLVRAGAASMDDYSLDELRDVFRSVMRKGTQYDREEVIHALARHLGFVRVTDTVRQPIKSAINSAIRHGTLGYEGSLIWREE